MYTSSGSLITFLNILFHLQLNVNLKKKENDKEVFLSN